MSYSSSLSVGAVYPGQPSRRALRRAVRMECAVESDLWDGPAPLVATDASAYGLWLATDLALESGAELLLTFRPPRWPQQSGPVTALAQVVRVGLPRRRADAGAAGMGLVFADIDRDQSAQMAELMRGLPPPLPSIARLSAFDPEIALEEIMLDDGSRFVLSAEGPLLTGGRRRSHVITASRSEIAAPSRQTRSRRCVRPTLRSAPTNRADKRLFAPGRPFVRAVRA